MKIRALIAVIIISFVSVLRAGAQEIYYPENFTVPSEFESTSTQKGVALSTDILLAAMPLATLTGVIVEKDWQGLKQACLTAAATVAATYILKYTVREERPNHKNMHSFPSGHASLSFANAAFLQRRYGWKVGGPAYAIATYIGVGRIWSKKHHWWDVVAGAAIGAGSAYIFTKPWAKEHSLSIAPVTDPVTSTYGLTASFSF